MEHKGGSSSYLRRLGGNVETIGSLPEGWLVFGACVFVSHRMFTQNTPFPLRTRSAHPSNLPRRRRHRGLAGQHVSQSDALATQQKLLSGMLSHSAAPGSCQKLSTKTMVKV